MGQSGGGGKSSAQGYPGMGQGEIVALNPILAPQIAALGISVSPAVHPRCLSVGAGISQ